MEYPLQERIIILMRKTRRIDDNNDSDDVSYVDNSDAKSVGFLEGFGIDEEGHNGEGSSKRPSKRQKIDRQSSENALNLMAASVTRLVDLRANEQTELTDVKRDVQTIRAQMQETQNSVAGIIIIYSYSYRVTKNS